MFDAPCYIPRALIVDDEEDVRWTLSKLLEKEGYQPLEVRDGESALRVIQHELVDFALLDMLLPDIDGMQVLSEARKIDPSIPIIMITGIGSINSAVEAMQKGAFDYVTKPFRIQYLSSLFRKALEKRESARKGSGKDCCEEDLSLQEAMGSSREVQKIIDEVNIVAPTDYSILINGETGSGKEVVARSIHRSSSRKDGPFVPVDCGSLSASLIENELFGHEKGSFTGADSIIKGKFEIAVGGTVFLDEIANLPLSMQPLPLRALQEKKIWRVGGSKAIAIDIRVIAATNQNLKVMVQEGQFRRDLYHRLNEFCINVPPLRERRDDIIFLAKKFLDLTQRKANRNVVGFSSDALEALLAYDWKGNVRELRNVVRRAVLVAENYIAESDLGLRLEGEEADSDAIVSIQPFKGNTSLKRVVKDVVARTEKELISRVLAQTKGNKAETARLLKIDYKTLFNKIKEYALYLGK